MVTVTDPRFNATKVYIGGSRDGETTRCIRPARWPLSISGHPMGGGRHTYELDVVESTADRAVYRYVGHLAEQVIYRRDRQPGGTT